MSDESTSEDFSDSDSAESQEEASPASVGEKRKVQSKKVGEDDNKDDEVDSSDTEDKPVVKKRKRLQDYLDEKVIIKLTVLLNFVNLE